MNGCFSRWALTSSAALLLAAPWAHAGPYPGFKQTGDPAFVGIASDDPRISAWADQVITATPTSGGGGNSADVLGSYSTSTYSLGDLGTTAISNGDAPGSITVSFEHAIYNGEGADLAVFENGGDFFDSDKTAFAELAYVEVSSDGDHFARFPGISLNEESDLDTTFGRAFAGLDTTNVFNLAGKHGGGIGTGFDLDDLASHTLVQEGTLDLDAISQVRVVDIPGDGSFADSDGNPIFDSWNTNDEDFSTGGFDMQALGAIHTTPEPASVMLLGFGGLALARRGRRREV